MKSTGSLETCIWVNKDLVCKKQEIECNDTIKQYKHVQLMLINNLINNMLIMLQKKT